MFALTGKASAAQAAQANRRFGPLCPIDSVSVGAALGGVRIQSSLENFSTGAVAQLGERLICIQEVIGSIPVSSTNRDQLSPAPQRLGL